MGRFKQVPTNALAVGSILRAPITDPGNNRLKLLGEGVEITQQFLDRLESRGICYVEISLRDLAIMSSFRPQGRGNKIPEPIEVGPSTETNEWSEKIDTLLENVDSLAMVEVAEPVSTRIDRPSDCSYSDGLQQQWAQDHDVQIHELSQFTDEAVHGDALDAGPLRILCGQILDKLAEDADALVCLGATPHESDYPTRHGLHTATIAMAIGVELELGEEQLIDLGMGCLAHDLGMHKIGVPNFETKGKFSLRVRELLGLHPIESLDVASKFGETISDTSRIVAYQVHERLDGSGYPRGIGIDKIHTLSRIAAVADAFVDLIAPRSHRIGVQAHHVIVHLLDEMKTGKYDPKVVRALLQATSLYPIGSCVELNNGKVGRVIRTGGTQFTKPTVEMWSLENIVAQPTVVNLQCEPAIEIVCSIASIEAAATYA